jgi:hypothetical protein
VGYTIFGNVDLSVVKNLETVQHREASTGCHASEHPAHLDEEITQCYTGQEKRRKDSGRVSGQTFPASLDFLLRDSGYTRYGAVLFCGANK